MNFDLIIKIIQLFGYCLNLFIVEVHASNNFNLYNKLTVSTWRNYTSTGAKKSINTQLAVQTRSASVASSISCEIMWFRSRKSPKITDFKPLKMAKIDYLWNHFRLRGHCFSQGHISQLYFQLFVYWNRYYIFSTFYTIILPFQFSSFQFSQDHLDTNFLFHVGRAYVVPSHIYLKHRYLTQKRKKITSRIHFYLSSCFSVNVSALLKFYICTALLRSYWNQSSCFFSISINFKLKMLSSWFEWYKKKQHSLNVSGCYPTKKKLDLTKKD